MAALSSDPDSAFHFSSSQNPADVAPDSQSDPAQTQENDETEVDREESEKVQPEPILEHPISSQREKLSQLAENAMSFMPSSLSRQGSGVSTTDVDDSVVKSFTSTPGYLANRWNNYNSSSSTPPSSHIPTTSTPPM